jgi:hypothetical protein
MNKEEKESTKLETLIELLYTDRLSQYGKRKLVNYIEKQRKEIEALEIIHNTYKEMIEENNYISKDKIREKISQLKEIADEDNTDIYIKIDAYEELLEENEKYENND